MSEKKKQERKAPRSRAVVVCPVSKKTKDARFRQPEARLAEACGLAMAISLDVVDSKIVSLSAPRPATFLGQGAVDEIAEIIKEGEAELVIVDAQLSPVQQRNLERAWSCKTIDRTGLILEIFGERARTKEGRMQVELAALSYQRSRLVRSWTHLERQRGGFGFMGGPGETQIEADRRLIGDRIARLRRELEEVRRTRKLHRDARKRVPYPVIALVGYTNAGKSTLFNKLTKADVMAEDLLFATLDPTMRALILPSGQKAILSDTVGFVSDLPHELVAAFRATLEEVEEADIVVHVRDVSHIDSEEQKQDVEKVLLDLGLEETVHHGMIEAQNKIDLLSSERKIEIENQARRAGLRIAPLSAISGEGIDSLLTLLDEALAAKQEIMTIALAPEEGAALAWLHQHGEILSRNENDEGVILLSVRMDPANARRFEKKRGGAL